MRRLAAVSIAATLGLLLMCGQALASGTPAVGNLRVAINSNAVSPNFAWTSSSSTAAAYTASHEQVVILQAWETSELRAIKAANPSVKVLMYQNASSASTSASADGTYSTGVSYSQANANGWLLRNTSGNPFTFNGESWLYATDIGAGAYQSAWAQNVISLLKKAPWDGVFIDDVNPTISYHYTPSAVAKYPTDAAYSTAMGSFVSAVGPQIQNAGELAVANIGSWSGYNSICDGWLRSLSGGMDEQFLKWGSTAGQGYAWQGTWANQLHEVSLAASENKMFLGVTHSAPGDEAAAVYGYATMLLAGNGMDSFTMAPDYTAETWFPEYDYKLGAPSGTYTVAADGVYRRNFASGVAVVNPTSSAQSITLGGSYTGTGFSHVSSLTLGPQSGAVLVADSGTSTVAAAPTSGSTTGGSTGTGTGTATGTGTGTGTATGTGTGTGTVASPSPASSSATSSAPTTGARSSSATVAITTGARSSSTTVAAPTVSAAAPKKTAASGASTTSKRTASTRRNRGHHLRAHARRSSRRVRAAHVRRHAIRRPARSRR